MLEHSMIQNLLMWGIKCQGVWWLWVWGGTWRLINSCFLSPSINNCMVLGSAWVWGGREQSAFESYWDLQSSISSIQIVMD